MADRVLGELAFLPRECVDHRPVGARRGGKAREADQGEAVVPVGPGRIGQVHGKVAPADLAGELGHQQVVLHAGRLVGDGAVEADAGAPRRIAGDFSHGTGDRPGAEGGTRLRRGFEPRHGGGKGGQGASQSLKRKLAIEAVGVDGSHLVIAVGLCRLSGALGGVAGPPEALGSGLRGARRSAIAVEQRGRCCGIAPIPQCAGATQPHQRGVIVTQAEPGLRDVLARGEGIVHTGRDALGGAGIGQARDSEQFGDPGSGIERARGQRGTVGQQRHCLCLAALLPQFATAVVEVARIGQRSGVGRRAVAALEDGEAGGEERLAACAGAGQLAGGGGFLALPQQGIHPRIVVIRGQVLTVHAGDGGFGHFAHLPAAPGLAGERGGPGRIAAGKGQRVMGDGEVGDRRVAVEEGQNRLVRHEFAAQTLFGAGAQRGLFREAGVGEQEAGIALERQFRAAILEQLLPAADFRSHRAGPFGHKGGAGIVPCDRVPIGRNRLGHGRLHRGEQGSKDGDQQGQANHAGHNGGPLLIRP